MRKDISFRLIFSKELSEDEQNILWDHFVEFCDKHDWLAGGGHDCQQLEWTIVYSAELYDESRMEELLKEMVSDKNVSDYINSFELI